MKFNLAERKRDKKFWTQCLVVGLLVLLLLYPLFGPQTSASPREVLDLYHRYLKNFEFSKAYFLLTDNYKNANLPEDQRRSRWLYFPETPFKKRVWSMLEINCLACEEKVEGERVAFKVEYLDYLSAEKIESTIVMVEAGGKWEIDDIKYSAIMDL